MSETTEMRPGLSELKLQAEAMGEHDEKSLRRSFILKMVVLVFITAYMGWAYVSLRPVDAKLVVFIAEEKIYEFLPSAKAQMKERLTRMAPRVVDDVGNEALKNLPRLGKAAQETARTILNDLSTDLQKDMIGWLSEFISENKAVIDDQFPGISSYEKITLLRQMIIEDTQDSITGVSDEIGLSLSAHPLTKQLRRLVQAKDLTDKEKLQQEVLGLWYLLVQQKLKEF